jgi:hypothetical protein
MEAPARLGSICRKKKQRACWNTPVWRHLLGLVRSAVKRSSAHVGTTSLLPKADKQERNSKTKLSRAAEQKRAPEAIKGHDAEKVYEVFVKKEEAVTKCYKPTEKPKAKK